MIGAALRVALALAPAPDAVALQWPLPTAQALQEADQRGCPVADTPPPGADAACQLQAGLALMKKGRLDAAERALRGAYAGGLRGAAVLLPLGELALQRGDGAAAADPLLTLLRRGYGAAPGSGPGIGRRLWWRVGEAALLQGRLREAAAALQRSCRTLAPLPPILCDTDLPALIPPCVAAAALLRLQEAARREGAPLPQGVRLYAERRAAELSVRCQSGYSPERQP